MSAAPSTTSDSPSSVFQQKYDEFVSDLTGSLPEYKNEIHAAFLLGPVERLNRFQAEVKVGGGLGNQNSNNNENPKHVLPGVVISDSVWKSLSAASKNAIWQYVRLLSICCFMETGFGNDMKDHPFMQEAMNEMKNKLENLDFSKIIGGLMKMFTAGDGSNSASSSDAAGPEIPGLKGIFENGFPKLPERFLKGHMAKLAQEFVKEITPADLGITEENIEECKKDPSRAFQILISCFQNDPHIIQRIIGKIGHRIQKKVQSGAINPMEIAREAEEMMKEFAENTSFVEVLSGIKTAFGFEDMEMAKSVGREGTARLAIARNRLRDKLEKKKQAANNQAMNKK